MLVDTHGAMLFISLCSTLFVICYERPKIYDMVFAINTRIRTVSCPISLCVCLYIWHRRHDYGTGTGTYNSVLGTLVRDSPNTFSGQVPDNWYQVTASYGNCAVSNILACFIVYKIIYLSQMTATSW